MGPGAWVFLYPQISSCSTEAPVSVVALAVWASLAQVKAAFSGSYRAGTYWCGFPVGRVLVDTYCSGMCIPILAFG